MDLLGDFLAVAGVRGTVAATVEAGESWGLSLARMEGAAFHAITTGTAWLWLDDKPQVRLMPGDVVLLPTGVAHGLSSDAGSTLLPFERLMTDQAAEASGRLRLGDEPWPTRILCASYRQDPAVTTPLLSLLPDVLHVPGGSGDGALDGTVRLLGTELAAQQPGSSTVIDRLVDVLLVQLVRAWLRSEPVAPSMWLGALRDPTVSAALTAMHAHPGYPWTVDSLAREASVSRATLARRFASLVGETPAAYLTRWRMDLAARMLRDTDESVAAVSRSVGYTSEYSFSRAFSRLRSMPPSRYRSLSRVPAARSAPVAEPSETHGTRSIYGLVEAAIGMLPHHGEPGTSPPDTARSVMGAR